MFISHTFPRSLSLQGDKREINLLCTESTIRESKTHAEQEHTHTHETGT